MSRHRLYNFHPQEVRNSLNAAKELSEKIHTLEAELVDLLSKIDENRFYVRYGYNSLRGFCNFGLNFSKTQSQRITTLTRRTRTTSNHEQSRG